MTKVSSSLESATKTVVNANNEKDIKPSAQNRLVKLVKVDREGRTIRTELVSSADADAFIKAQTTNKSGEQIVQSSSQQAPIEKPVDIQALNRDIDQKNVLDRQLANQRVSMINTCRTDCGYTNKY